MPGKCSSIKPISGQTYYESRVDLKKKKGAMLLERKHQAELSLKQLPFSSAFCRK